MNGSDRAALRAHQPCGRLLRVCVILVLTAVWLAPPPAATANTRRPQETGETPQATIDCLSRDPLRPEARSDPNSDFQHCIDAGDHPTTGVQSEASDSAPAVAPAVPDLGYWAAGFGPMGVSGKVFAMAVGLDGSLYGWGRVHHCWRRSWQTTLPNGIETISSWRSLGTGMSYNVNALAVHPRRLALPPGGRFTTAGGVSNQLHRPLGLSSQWRPLGSGMGRNGRPTSLCPGIGDRTAPSMPGGVHNGWRCDCQLHRPLGWFPMAPPGQRNGSVRSLPWRSDRTARSTLGAGSPPPAGWRPTISPAGMATAWHALGSGISGGNSRVFALAFGPHGSLYAGGYSPRPVACPPTASPGGMGHHGTPGWRNGWITIHSGSPGCGPDGRSTPGAFSLPPAA